MPDTSEFDPPFELVEPPDSGGPLLYNSPHSGNVFPSGFLSLAKLALPDLKRSSDLYMDEMIIGAVSRGIPVMRAHFPRCFVDVNREPYELDPSMFEGRIPAFANSRSTRVAAGYGTIARFVGEQQDIYRRKLPVAEGLRRIDQYYLPYHASLRRVLSGFHRMHGLAVLIDWHSMPSAVFGPHRSVDIVLGDRHGTSCAPQLIDFVEATIRSMGLTVQRNQPYAGGFITEHYGNPHSGLHALQIEINRALYMDEQFQERHSGFEAMREAMMALTEALAGFDGVRPCSLALAAE